VIGVECPQFVVKKLYVMFAFHFLPKTIIGTYLVKG
jgi:hypothetical protein